MNLCVRRSLKGNVTIALKTGPRLQDMPLINSATTMHEGNTTFQVACIQTVREKKVSFVHISFCYISPSQ